MSVGARLRILGCTSTRPTASPPISTARSTAYAGGKDWWFLAPVRSCARTRQPAWPPSPRSWRAATLVLPAQRALPSAPAPRPAELPRLQAVKQAGAAWAPSSSACGAVRCSARWRAPDGARTAPSAALGKRRELASTPAHARRAKRRCRDATRAPVHLNWRHCVVLGRFCSWAESRRQEALQTPRAPGAEGSTSSLRVAMVTSNISNVLPT